MKKISNRVILHDVWYSKCTHTSYINACLVSIALDWSCSMYVYLIHMAAKLCNEFFYSVAGIVGYLNSTYDIQNTLGMTVTHHMYSHVLPIYRHLDNEEEILLSISVRYQSNTFASVRCLIDVGPTVFAVWTIMLLCYLYECKNRIGYVHHPSNLNR